MAPVAICTPILSSDFIQALEISIAEHRQVYPAPKMEALISPYVRQRIMHTKAIGRLHKRNDAHLCVLPFSHWTQNTLPNIFEVHQVSAEELSSKLALWKDNLSTLGTDVHTRETERLKSFFPRVVSLGEMQTPVFPRNHDGYPMFMSTSNT